MSELTTHVYVDNDKRIDALTQISSGERFTRSRYSLRGKNIDGLGIIYG